jgi:hypothetical protein
VPIGTDVTIAIRPESIRLVESTDSGSAGVAERDNALDVTVTEASFLGDHYEYAVAAGSIELIAQSQSHLSGPALTAVIEASACAVVSDTPEPAYPDNRHDATGIAPKINGNGSSAPMTRPRSTRASKSP